MLVAGGTMEQVVQPGGQAFADAFPHLGDIERDIYDLLVELRCAPFLLAYAQVRGPPCCVCESMIHCMAARPVFKRHELV